MQQEDAEEPKNREYFVYLLRCEDETLYAGITVDLARRTAEHRAGAPHGAKYTRSHPPRSLAAAWRTHGRSAASVAECRIKKLSRTKKDLIAERPEDAGKLIFLPEEGVELTALSMKELEKAWNATP